MRRLAFLIAFALPFGAFAAAQAPAVAADGGTTLRAAIAADTRNPANTARDRYRHPYETLSFFGVKPTDTVVEIWPGGGWYTEILAPYLAAHGTYYVAGNGSELDGVKKRIASNPAVYGHIQLTGFPVSGNSPKVPDNSVDAVLTFRNVHNWLGSEGEPPFADEAFRQMYAMLKPGGILGVEEHRLPEAAPATREIRSGYLKVSTVRRLAEAAGFRFVGASEVNANPKDTADWPRGVWTLPPTLILKDQDRGRYLAIGESDRMTLKFAKPLR